METVRLTQTIIAIPNLDESIPRHTTQPDTHFICFYVLPELFFYIVATFPFNS
jgi:hypothetical protein